MKKQIIITVCLFIPLFSIAQQQTIKEPTGLDAHSFEAEGQVHFLVANAIPMSQMAWYSSVTGGMQLNTTSVNEMGITEFITNRVAPKMVVNTTNTSTGKTGSNLVSFLGEKDFTIKQITLKHNNATPTIGWLATVANVDDIVFEVWESENGAPFGLWKTVSPMNSKGECEYKVPVVNSLAKTTYQVRVMSKSTPLSYTSRILGLDALSVVIYPSITNGTINVDINDAQKDYYYKISNTNGQLIKKGVLTDEKNTIFLEDLAPAIYFISVVQNNAVKTTQRIVKY